MVILDVPEPLEPLDPEELLLDELLVLILTVKPCLMVAIRVHISLTISPIWRLSFSLSKSSLSLSTIEALSSPTVQLISSSSGISLRWFSNVATVSSFEVISLSDDIVSEIVIRSLDTLCID